MNKRLIASLLTGAILGVVCIIGAQLRYDGVLKTGYLISFWFNRVLIGLVIGLISSNICLPKRILRGFLVGLLISFAFYSATEFMDLTGFLVGGIYGMIIEFVGYQFVKKTIKN
ncbi:hypothetical protein RJI07_03170 [Mycoplasmatota bacterium WC30]